VKTLYLIRHAKSDWSDPLSSDFERGLNKRGKADAPLMGDILLKKGIHPDLILSSPAHRAKATAFKIAQKLSYSIDAIRFEPSLYSSDVETICSLIRGVSDKIDSLIIFGHNPEFTECANMICGSEIDNIPTCGVVAMQLNTKSWESIGSDSAKLLFFETPKKHR
jgi:phosphohistidine phosphatase